MKLKQAINTDKLPYRESSIKEVCLQKTTISGTRSWGAISISQPMNAEKTKVPKADFI
jgi:hypothetical protein